jgi:Domain of unknown function (DUF4405)
MSTTQQSLARNTITPIAAVLFLVSTITGVMLFFHYKGGLVKESHEWLSIVFSVIAIWHLVRNWSRFTPYFKRNSALVAFGLTLIASLAFTAATGRDSGGGPRMVFMALSNATLEHTAPAFNLSLDEAMKRLKLAGYDAVPNETLNIIGKRAGKRGGDILFILAKKKEK